MTFAAWERVVLALAILVSAGIFGRDLAAKLRLVSAGRSDRPRTDRFGSRLWRVVREVLFHARVVGGRPVVGLLHAVVFFGFVAFGLETTDHFLEPFGVPFLPFVLRGLVGQRWPIAVYVVLVAVIAYGPPLVFWRVASARWGTGNASSDIGLTVRWVDAGWGPVTWLSCFLAQAVVGVIVVATKIPFQNNTDQIRAARDNPGYVIPMLVLAVLAAPIVEEIVFRGMVLRLSLIHI